MADKQKKEKLPVGADLDKEAEKQNKQIDDQIEEDNEKQKDYNGGVEIGNWQKRGQKLAKLANDGHSQRYGGKDFKRFGEKK